MGKGTVRCSRLFKPFHRWNLICISAQVLLQARPAALLGSNSCDRSVTMPLLASCLPGPGRLLQDFGRWKGTTGAFNSTLFRLRRSLLQQSIRPFPAGIPFRAGLQGLVGAACGTKVQGSESSKRTGACLLGPSTACRELWLKSSSARSPTEAG